jgi:hypothetical protein
MFDDKLAHQNIFSILPISDRDKQTPDELNRGELGVCAI